MTTYVNEETVFFAYCTNCGELQSGYGSYFLYEDEADIAAREHQCIRGSGKPQASIATP